ncbi:MAG: hypothetical protein HOK38_06895 [Flavobacteriaceae bacterium]|jgi:hypothetical protein|nr:hypothetical protein [Flavobacteriaceae bacterium]
MDFIIHRVNSIKKLKEIPSKFGCEIDIRSLGSNLILNHDPYNKGDRLQDYLEEYDNGTLILNIKESGIEDDVIKQVNKRGIKEYFLLDVEFPYIYKSVLKGEKKIAVRFSEMEPIQNLINLEDKLDWVWIDTITKLPINEGNFKILEKFKSCLVCPSRWGRSSEIAKIKLTLDKLNFNLDYVMTELKYINKWES